MMGLFTITADVDQAVIDEIARRINAGDTVGVEGLGPRIFVFADTHMPQYHFWVGLHTHNIVLAAVGDSEQREFVDEYFPRLGGGVKKNMAEFLGRVSRAIQDGQQNKGANGVPADDAGIPKLVVDFT